MGFTHFFTESKTTLYDNALHCIVFFVIGLLQLFSINKHPDSKIVAGLSGAALGTAWTSAIYHLGIGIQQTYAKQKELHTGEALRNLLTTLTLVLTTANVGVVSGTGAAFGLDMGSSDPHTAIMGFNALCLFLLLLARFLDMLLDHDTFGGVLDIDKVKVKGWEDDRTVEPMWGNTALNGRIVITHILLLGATVTSWMAWVGGDDMKLQALSSGDKDILVISTILITTHFILYPLVMLSNMIGASDMIISVISCKMCGVKKAEESEGDKTLESLNRVPLVRFIVTSAVILGVSFLSGHSLENARSQLILLVLAFYVAADAVGRHVV